MHQDDANSTNLDSVLSVESDKNGHSIENNSLADDSSEKQFDSNNIEILNDKKSEKIVSNETVSIKSGNKQFTLISLIGAQLPQYNSIKQIFVDRKKDTSSEVSETIKLDDIYINHMERTVIEKLEMINFLSELNSRFVETLFRLSLIRLLCIKFAQNIDKPALIRIEDIQTMRILVKDFKTIFEHHTNELERDNSKIKSALQLLSSLQVPESRSELDLIDIKQSVAEAFQSVQSVFRLGHELKNYFYHQRLKSEEKTPSDGTPKNQTTYLNQIKKLKSILLMAKKENDSLSNQISSFENEKTTLNTKYSTCLSELELANDNLKSLQEENKILKTSLQGDKDRYEDEILKNQAKIESLTHDLFLSNEKLNSLKKEVDERFNKLKNSPSMPISDNLHFEAERQKILLETNELSEKIREQQQTIEDLNHLNDQLSAKINEKDSCISSLKKELKNAQKAYQDQLNLFKLSTEEKNNHFESKIEDTNKEGQVFQQPAHSSNNNELDQSGTSILLSNNEGEKVDEKLPNIITETPSLAIEKEDQIKVLEGILQNFSTNHGYDSVDYLPSGERTQMEEISQALTDTETENSLLRQQVDLLKEEIRRLERESKRDKNLSQVDFFKDTFINFISGSPDEKQKILPAVVELLQPNKNELQKISLFSIMNLTPSESGKSGILSSIASYITNWK